MAVKKMTYKDKILQGGGLVGKSPPTAEDLLEEGLLEAGFADFGYKNAEKKMSGVNNIAAGNMSGLWVGTGPVPEPSSSHPPGNKFSVSESSGHIEELYANLAPSSSDKNKMIAAAVSAGVKQALESILPALAHPPTLVKLSGKTGHATITIKHADGTTQTSEEELGTPQLFTGPPCNVGLSSKLTIPLAAYSNAQVSVSLNVPCGHGEIDQVYDFAKNWVDKRMEALAKEVNVAKVFSG